MAAAAKRTLVTRGDLSTGWAIAWRLNLWSRLGEGDHAHGILKLLLGPERTYPNMFDAHPPFQIDGNFGGTSGMTEMVLQSRNDRIYLLPALPSAWPTGHITGLRAARAVGVDVRWAGGKLTEAVLTAKAGGKHTVVHAGSSLEPRPQERAKRSPRRSQWRTGARA
ncbi:glycosyl hydrolase family 95 catalytic domain-containing protein [Caulobacter segnis]